MLRIFDIDSAQLFSIEQAEGKVSPLYFCRAAGLPSLAQRHLAGSFRGLRRQRPESAFGSALKAAISRHDLLLVEVLLKNDRSILDDRLIERPFKLTRIGPYTIIEPATQLDILPWLLRRKKRTTSSSTSFSTTCGLMTFR